MRYVLDSCVALTWVLPEVDSDKALRLRASVQAGVHTLLAPDVFPPEVGDALTRAERKGIIPVGRCPFAQHSFDAAAVLLVPPDPPPGNRHLVVGEGRRV